MKILAKMRDAIAEAKELAFSAKMRLMCLMAFAMAGCLPMTSYAAFEFTQESINTFLESAIEIIFSLMAAGVGVWGAFQLVPGIISFVQASQSQNGEQRKEAGSSIAFAVILLMLAGGIFMLQSPVKTFFGLSD